MRLPPSSLAVVVAVACSTEPLLAPPSPELRDAPEEVTVDGLSVRLETYLWRDFQPVAPPDGQPLIAVLRVMTTDGTPVPPTLHADQAWVIADGVSWAASVREEQGRVAGSPSFEVVARDGPKWGPGIAVDVVIRLRASSGAPVLLSARGQSIHRTE
jgi:hypothetical protein